MTTQTQPRPEWTALIDRNRQNVSYAALGVGAVLLVAAAVLMWKYGWEQAALIVGFLIFGLAALGCGLWFQSAATGEMSGRDSARLFVLILGAALGLALVVGGIWQTIAWWRYVVGGGKEGTEEEVASEPWRVWVLVAAVLAGLVVMFNGLFLARTRETDNPTSRRLFYGYVAVLTVVLLLAVLVGLNILGYYYLPKSSDWTEAGIYTLSSKSENVLKGLSQPVTVYVMEQQRGDRFDVEMRDLIDNARSVTDKIHAEYVIRDINVNEMAKLKARYKPDDDLGLIVVYGSGDQAQHTFIPMREVLPPPPFDPTGRERPKEPSFKGEDRLTSAISFLEEGKKKPVLYFTQGNGELDLFGAAPGARPSQRAQSLATRLGRDNYEVKGLLLDVETPAGTDPHIVKSKTVPDDAALVVIAGPTKPFKAGTLDALRKYMNETHKVKDPIDPDKQVDRKGKLMVLAGVVAGQDDRMAPLGLDKLLSDFDVKLTDERVLRAVRPDEHPELVNVTPNPDLKGKNPLATLFERRYVPMLDVRVVRAGGAPPPPGGAPRFQSSELMESLHPAFRDGDPVFAETDLRPAADVMTEWLKKPAELEKKLQATLPVAVAVSDPGGPDPSNPHAFMNPNRGEGAPRLVVIGDNYFASDQALVSRGGRGDDVAAINYNLFASAVAWLREKPSSMGIEAKDRGSYTMRQDTSISTMLLFPLGLMSLTVVGLGLGVWVARRR